MKSIYKISKIFLLLSIATIFIKKWTILSTPLKISDAFLFISFILIVILILNKDIIIKPHIIKSIKHLFIIFLILSLGSLISLLIFKNLPLNEILLSYLRIISCFLIFLEIIIFTSENQKFLKSIFISLFLSFVVIPISYLFPQLILNGFLLDSSSFRFAGMFNDPNYYANFIIFPTLGILYYFLKEKIILNKIFFFLIFSLSLGFIIWTGSRSGWLGLISALGFLIIFEYKLNGFKKSIITSSYILIAFIIGLLLIPPIAQTQITERLHIFIQNKDISKNKWNTGLSITKGQNRLLIWRQSIKEFTNNPVGYGPGYNSIIDISEEGGDHSVSQNIILQILLTGGIPLFIYLLFILKKNYQKFKKNIFNNYLILSAIIGTLISSLFIDSFESKWIWVYLAIYISLNLIPKNSDSSSVNL